MAVSKCNQAVSIWITFIHSLYASDVHNKVLRTTGGHA